MIESTHTHQKKNPYFLSVNIYKPRALTPSRNVMDGKAKKLEILAGIGFKEKSDSE